MLDQWMIVMSIHWMILGIDLCSIILVDNDAGCMIWCLRKGCINARSKARGWNPRVGSFAVLPSTPCNQKLTLSCHRPLIARSRGPRCSDLLPSGKGSPVRLGTSWTLEHGDTPCITDRDRVTRGQCQISGKMMSERPISKRMQYCGSIISKHWNSTAKHAGIAKALDQMRLNSW